jgi:hypothetical protein
MVLAARTRGAPRAIAATGRGRSLPRRADKEIRYFIRPIDLTRPRSIAAWRKNITPRRKVWMSMEKMFKQAANPATKPSGDESLIRRWGPNG